LQDVRDHSFQIVSDFFGRNAKGLHASLMSPKVAPLVTSWIVAIVVRQSVDLNRDAGSFAEEVEHKRAKRMLLAELQPIRPKTQHSPEPDL